MHIKIDTIFHANVVETNFNKNATKNIKIEATTGIKIFFNILRGEKRTNAYISIRFTNIPSKRTKDLDIYKASKPYLTAIRTTGQSTIKCKNCDRTDKRGRPLDL